MVPSARPLSKAVKTDFQSSSYKGAKAGDKDWNKKFDDNWQLIKKDLKDFDTVADANAKKERSDILSTKNQKP